MRLAQAARNLSITTDDIVTFLAKKDIVIEKDSNTKLDENSIHLLFEYFDTDIPLKKEVKTESVSVETNSDEELAPQPEENDLQKEEAESPIKEDDIVEPDTSQEGKLDSEEAQERDDLNESLTVEENLGEEEPINKEEENQMDEQVSAKPTTKKYKTVADLLGDEQDEDNDVVIKAPKVSLQGLNVLGKIDLPEPKPKQEKEEDQKHEKKEQNKNRSLRRPASRNTRKELTPQQLREREKKKELRKREEVERKAKKKREAFYKEQILKPKQEQQKKKKPKQKKTTEKIKNQIQPKPIPKTVLGKFWRWLNT